LGMKNSLRPVLAEYECIKLGVFFVKKH
jgi:hypothetical protein